MAAFQRFLHASSATLPRQCLSASVLFATGDIIAQQAVEKRGAQHDVMRTTRLAAYGGVVFAPIMATWFGKVLERVQFKSKLANVATKVTLDQLIMSPTIVSVFFTATTLMEGKSIEDVKEKLRTSWYPTLKAAWGVWAPVQALNFAVVPVNQRLLFVNVVSVGWNTFLSVQANGGKNEAKAEAKVDRLEAPILSGARDVERTLESAALQAKQAGVELEQWIEKEGGDLAAYVKSLAGQDGGAKGTLDEVKRTAERSFVQLRQKAQV